MKQTIHSILFRTGVGAVLWLLMAGVLAPACQKQKTESPAQTLTVMTHPGEDGVSGQEGVCHVTIYATGEWEAESSASWAILTDEYGPRGINDITVRIKRNTTGEQRSATLTFTCGNTVGTYVLTQNQL